MSEVAWDGHDLLAAMRHAAGTLNSRVDEVNALNVFPVPDGDTGSNMVATVQAAIDEADELPEKDRTVSHVASALSLGALMGARGNSGVILSQLFRGLGEAVDGARRIGGAELAEALEQGCRAAFAAVAQPVEGTILTVARDVARAAAEAAASEKPSLEGVLAAAATEATASVERTPQLLSILRRAGVVDAGGKGLELLLRGALASVRGEQLAHVSRLPQDIVLPLADALEAEGYGYETVFVVTPHEGSRLDILRIRRRLEQLGESVLVGGDARAAKVHVHNERPDKVINFGLSLGTLSRISVENLDRQATAIRDQARAAEQQRVNDTQPGTTIDGPQVVAVAAGEGWARVFSTLGVSAVVAGGQSANPSAGELADAIRATGADEVIVLPNNRNVSLAAKQAGQLCPDIEVVVVPTRNAAEGVAALLAFDAQSNLKDAARQMTKAARGIQTLQVTAAVRDSRFGRRKVRRGDTIVLSATDGLVAVDRDRTEAILDAVRRLKPGFELLTVYRGRGIGQGAAEKLRDALRNELGGVEIELVDGGQPHYHFLISVE